jgi:type II secretory pathway predicted ATPase ExeA
MSYQPQAQVTLEQVPKLVPVAVDTARLQTAIRQLTVAFQERRSVCQLIGESRLEASHVAGAFIAGLGDEVAAVRLKAPHTDALAAMREINRALGFAPKALSLSDQQNILTMFLECQSKHRRRTVLCIEHVDQQPLWLLDTLGSLIDSEASKPSDLLVVLSGDSGLQEVLRNPSLSVLRKNAGAPVKLAPYSLRETKDFVRQQVEALGLGEVSRLFDFEAVSQLYKLSGGSPDTVSKLVRESLLLAKPGEHQPVTVESVIGVARQLRLESIDLTLMDTDTTRREALAENVERLVVRLNGLSLDELPLREGRFLIGRSASADIYLPSSLVSRNHAAIVKTASFVKVEDLDSTNGTYVGGRRISECRLETGDVVDLGECQIQYLTGGSTLQPTPRNNLKFDS